MTIVMERPWLVIVVEDNQAQRESLCEFLNGEDFPFGKVTAYATDSFADAQKLLSERKVDVLILDVFAGPAEKQQRAGLDVLGVWKQTGFAPVILHTALPEGLDSNLSPFVRVLAKSPDSLKNIRDELTTFFELKVPQLRRGLVEHLDRSFRDYMWGFVVDNWTDFEPILSKPDFIRLLVQRLSARLSRDGISTLIDSVHPGAESSDTLAPLAHPAHFYVKPVETDHALLGDVLTFCDDAGSRSYRIVLQPSCDLVNRGVKGSKVERAIAARAVTLESTPEFTRWCAAQEVASEADSVAKATKEVLDTRKSTAIERLRNPALLAVREPARTPTDEGSSSNTRPASAPAAPAALPEAAPQEADEKALLMEADSLVASEKIAARDAQAAAAKGSAAVETARKELARLLKNDRGNDHQPDRWHFLPPAFDIPALVVDFLALETIPVADINKEVRVGTIASPFAEALGARFVRYLARVGSPDLDVVETLRLIQRPKLS